MFIVAYDSSRQSELVVAEGEVKGACVGVGVFNCSEVNLEDDTIAGRKTTA